MKGIVSNAAFPALLPALFFAVAATPVDLLGCRNRGLAAVAIALVGALGALVAAVVALRGRARRDPGSVWWIVSTVILAAPAVAVLLLAR